MKRCIIYLAMTLAMAIVGCHKADDTPAPQPETIATQYDTINVDVILPQSIYTQLKKSINLALGNIEKAQQNLQRKIVINMRYHDEDTENLDVLGNRLANPQPGDDTCHAVIGPWNSPNAMSILRYAKRKRLPVVMPTCSSAELQRTNAKNTYAWFLTESDITQCEIMVSSAYALKATDVALVYSDNNYGQSFRDWFGYYASEQQLHIAGGSTAYKKGDDISAFLQEAVSSADGGKLIVLVALSDPTDYKAVCDQCTDAQNDDVRILTICSDTSLDNDMFGLEDFYTFNYGICPSGNMNYGFPQTYHGLYEEDPYNGCAQIYDAFTTIALGAALQAACPDRCIIDGKQVEYSEKPYEATLTDYMRAVVSSDVGTATQWDAAGLATAFSELFAGRNISVTGATGAMYFDSETHTNILNTTYKLWRYGGAMSDSEQSSVMVEPIIYLSTSGTSSEASSKDIWALDKLLDPTFEDVSYSHSLPKKSENWAVVISPSTTWSNYRHQADAFAMYQLLKSHGYDDDHIVLIVEDNLYNNSNNIFPGEIFVERGDNDANNDLVNMNVRKDAVVDYHFSDLTPSDIADIMLGKSSERLPQVISPTADDDVFFFWSGHGGNREGPLWGNEDAIKYFGMERIKNIVAEMNANDTYRRMFFAIETCYSGKWGEALEGQPDVLVMTAANPYEYSMADVHDKDLGVYLSNAFARTFRNSVTQKSDITVYDLFRNIYRTTIGSHVSIYNQQNYGSVYNETVEEYFD